MDPKRQHAAGSPVSHVRFWGHPRDGGSPPVQPEGLINIMMELKVTLDFECSICSHSIGVTLKCEGKGLTAGSRAVATVNVPCPTCGAVNQLYFEPRGTVQAVSPYRTARQVPEPSMN
jgi:hypothetical protein